MQSCFSHVQLFMTLWTVACQAPLSMGFSKQECWSKLNFLLHLTTGLPGNSLSLIFECVNGSILILESINENRDLCLSKYALLLNQPNVYFRHYKMSVKQTNSSYSFILEMCVLRMTRARRSQVEQQQLISVEKALAILSQPTPSPVVDHERLKVCKLKSQCFHCMN